jgi:hypothetical protein
MPNGRDEGHDAPRWRLRATRYLARQVALPVCGAALFAYVGFPYWSVVALAAGFTAFYFWLNRRALGLSRTVALASWKVPSAHVAFTFLLFWICVGAGFLAVQTATYVGVRWLVG